MAPDGEEDERNARKRSRGYVEDVSRNLTPPAGCQRKPQPERFSDRLLGLFIGTTLGLPRYRADIQRALPGPSYSPSS